MSCDLVFGTCPHDWQFFDQVFRHLVRAHHYRFQEKIIRVDLGNRRGVHRWEESSPNLRLFRDKCQRLVDDGIADRVEWLDYSDEEVAERYKAHFDHDIVDLHDHRGAPIAAYVFSLDLGTADYAVFFDSDMLLYPGGKECWVETGIDVMEKYPNIFYSYPMSGPPGFPRRGPMALEMESDDFWVMPHFSSRVYLINRRRFRDHLPLPVPAGIVEDKKHADVGMRNWELMVFDAMRRDALFGAQIVDRGWMVSFDDHRTDNLDLLPLAIEAVEAGRYPEQQIGFYNLKIPQWREMLAR